MLRHFKPFLIAACVIIIVFVAVSLLDVLVSVLYARFYSTAAFITTFAVGGVFAAVLGFQAGVDTAAKKDEMTRWGLIVFLIGSGLLYFLVLSKLEGGEYEAAFKGYGVTLALGSLFFVKGKF